MKKITGSQAVMESLLHEGVDVIFGYPGGAIMPVYDALYDYRDKIRHILVRHEQAAGHAAEGYARMTGRPGVALVTSGPGATNLVTAITDAMLDSVPMVCITGQVTSTLLGTDAFQEADVIGITTPVTKWNYQITNASEIPEVFAKAFHIAGTGRPGPVLIDITKDAQSDMINFSYKKIIQITGYQPNTTPNEKQLATAADLLNKAKQPFMLIGHGVLIAKAEKEAMQLAEKAQIPIGSTLHGLSGVPFDHPMYVGMLGMHGNYGPNVLTNQADVILAIGMRFDDRVTGRLADYAKQAKIIHIDIDPAELNKNVPAYVPIVADAKSALEKLLPKVKKNSHKEWLAKFKTFEKEEFEKVKKHEIHPASGEIKMAEVVHMLSEKTKGEAVVVADVGQHQMIAARYYQAKRTDSYLTSGGLGTMGFALPAAIGAKVAKPKRQVVAIIGDGSFQMNIQELATLAQDNIPVKAIILNNNFLGMVRQWQQLFFDKRYSFVELKNPDFVAVAKGFFVDAKKVGERKDLSRALDEMLASDKPYILEIKVEREDNIFPMVPTGASVEEIRLE
ncbi:MAG TPA: biosynthetic-type acetolactate synthase large subunit [Candidatus Saccharimonadales bacterium]|nr:biosynthetic-type acetolactate synthase large subunit [Candidatus Saccharimonadales bacterium]